MGTMTLHTRSFHPRESFGVTGFGFSGDNRGFSTNLGVTSRIRSQIDINLTGASVSANPPESDPSYHPAGMQTDYSHPDEQPTGRFTGGPSITPYRQDGAQDASFTYAYRGKNHAAVPKALIGGFVENRLGDWLNRETEKVLVPDLDVTISLSLSIDRAARKAHVTANMRGDGFPNAEAFLLDSGGAPLFLVSHVRVGTASGQLWGNALIRMASCALQVDLTPEDRWAGPVEVLASMDHAGDGSPQQIGRIGRTNVSAWNSVHTCRDAVGPASRRALDDNWSAIGTREEPVHR
ncbi:hypothetical protein [Roseinatronobacter alkalisoli]|uniref:Uncharacterized protein n=1 Tax=Roseinatronobacter alkalisoli TaxID=3028235 RepID=A0ABT5TF97_9RHOB|nr:hypothetical protein [Roseinatronobacter sp. HJB301]MDD7973800.1 hypothetical protein [Roseinatronobacter sp. HJB301]